MSRNLPEELAPALARTGHAWPQADEDGLRRAAGLWREFGSEADALVTRGAASAQRVSGENKGPAVEAFADHWRQFSGGGRGQLDDAAAAAALVAAALDKAAGAADQAKADIIAVLTELTEKIRAADAAEAKAKADIAQAGKEAATGLGGLVTGAVGAVVGAVKEVAAEAEELAAVEHAKVKIGQLLEQLGRDMGEAAKSLAKEPPLVALERIAQADGRGLHGEQRETSMAARSGQVTGALAKAGVARSVEVASVAGLHADVKADGTVRTDRHGNPVLVGEDGQRVKGVDGLTVTQGPDGKQQLVGPDGTPVSGVAMGEDGKPLLGSNGKPLLVGLGGAILGTGITLALGLNGKPELGDDGHPVMMAADGTQVSGLVADQKGHLLAGQDGQPVTVDASGRATGPGGQVVQFGADGRPQELLGADGKPVTVLDGQQQNGGPFQDGPQHGHGHGGLNGTGNGTGMGNGHGAQGPGGLLTDLTGSVTDNVTGVTDTVSGVTQSALGDRPQHGQSDTGGHRGGYQGGGGGSHGVSYGGSSAPAYSGPSGGGSYGGGGGSYDDGGSYGGGSYSGGGGGHSAPDRGPLSVHVDSVLAPPAPSAPPVVGGDIWSTGGGSYGGGGGHHAADPGSSFGGSGSSGGSSFQLGPVGGGGSAPVGGGIPAGTPVPGAPVAGAGPVGGPVGAAPGGAAAVPGAPGTPGAPGAVAGPVGGAAGAVGAPGATGVVGTPGTAGASGGSAAVVGVGQTPVGGRPAAGVPVPPAGGGGIGQHAPGTPARGYEPLSDVRRQAGQDDQGLPVHPGQASAAWLVIAGGRRSGVAGPLPAGERERTLADSRPYGLPGGLGPVDPAHQAEAVRRTPVPAPDPMVGEWIEVLNGGGPAESGRANNCVDVSLSAVDTLGGVPTCAAPRLPDGPAGERGGRDRAELELGTRFLDLGDGTDAHGKLGQALLAHGTGTRAVLLTVDAFGRSHTWNAVNHKGVLSYLDHQTGYAAPTPLYPADHGLWAIAVDAADRPIDLTAPLPATVAVPEHAPEREPALVGAAGPEAGTDGAAEEAAPADRPAPPRSRLTIHRTTTGSTSR
ncbi:toxin glutamine deamidase domain-containing protein [Kitasatospora cineracea]|uniref:F0F1-type ATP synthase membrane subunit b/b n=1 Tax=Kitasatospora cineracea TaxID=88074 RepID=A0A8G1XB05_9ACTN|nr:toxin glutamine deamidase domain-containing protein [Kitasatospora cineracea]ROR43745.1 F0F1-type ATP synthase membrane subunit b/b' [Kitasatospora cineracea]